MDSIYKILESLDQVNEGTHPEVEKFMDAVVASGDGGYDMIDDALMGRHGPAVQKQIEDMHGDVAREKRLHPDDDNEEITSALLDRIADDYPQKTESIEEGQYDGKSREELLKMKAEAEASIKNMKSSGMDPQSKFYDETQMMMAQQHLNFINDALKKVDESKTTQDGSGPYYQEQRAKEMAEKEGKDWRSMSYGDKEDYRAKAKKMSEAEITPIDHSEEEDGASAEDIASAITRRMMAHPKFGALVREVDIIDLNDAIEDVAQFHEGGDLGTSDVSAMVNDVLKQLGQPDALKEEEVEEAVSLDQARKYFFDKHDFADENIQGEYNKMASKMSSKDAMILKKELEKLYPDALNEEEVEEGNDFTKARLDAIKAGKDSFEVDGKTYKVTGDTSDEEKMTEDYDEDEYDEEGEMAKNQLDVVCDAVKELKAMIDDDDNLPEWTQKKITLAMDYIDTVRDYLKAVEPEMNDEEEVEFELEERKLSSSEEQEMERIVTAMKDDPETVKDMKKRYGDRWEEVAYATATKMAKEHGNGTGKKKKKTESTVAGAVATGADATGSSIYGNPSVYESMNTQVENMITESMNVSVNSSNDPNAEPSITVSATGEDAMALAQLLQLAAVPKQPCETCGRVHEGECMREENEANSADNTHTYDMEYLLNAISGGLNGQKRQINPNNPGDNPLAMAGIGKNSLNLEESEEDTSVSHLETLYKEFKSK